MSEREPDTPVTWREIIDVAAKAARSASRRWPHSVSEEVAGGTAALVRRALLDLHARHGRQTKREEGLADGGEQDTAKP